MIFPNLKNKTFGYLNLNTESIEWCNKKGIDSSAKNVLLDPSVCQEFIEDIHKKYSLDFSYGGWMEDRTYLWRGGYMEAQDKFVHLGVDINVPAGTEIATNFKAKVIKIGNNFDIDGGWGPYVILKHLERPIYIIYAHLDKNILCKIGDILDKDTIFSKVGNPPDNGNWFPHLHVQTISDTYYPTVEKNWELFDGYGFKHEKELNAKRYCDPIEFISF